MALEEMARHTSPYLLCRTNPAMTPKRLTDII